MFANSMNSTPGTAPSRRRPRPRSTENSVTQPKAKRQRSALNEHTFVAPKDAQEMEQVRPEAAVATLQNQTPADISTQMQELAVRPKKRRVANDRIAKGDGSTTLTLNEIYTVSKLPALPDRLRAEDGTLQHGAIYSDSGYALSLSHTHAVVWPYSVGSTIPETFTFTLPQASKHNTDALPLGTLVSASASEHEPGLVIVMPTTGKICYWESISSAATLDLIRKKQNGLEGSVPGMMSGETVIQILNAETAGFVLAFSSGRLAYMSVRDGQGRPAINVQFLHTGTGPRGGIFGSVRNLLVGSQGGDIAAIRAGPSTKVGERDVVMATSKGKLQAWQLHRGGHNSLRADLDLREQTVGALKSTNPKMQDLLLESFEIVDLAFSPQTARSQQSLDEDALELVLLTSMTSRSRSFYALIEITLGSSFNMGRIINLSSYTTPVTRTSACKPRLYLPSPGLTAFVVFNRSVVTISMARQQATPEMQILGGSPMQSTTAFEDVIDFRDALDLEIIGSGEEEPYGNLHSEDHKSRKHRAKFPAVVLLVQKVGLVRIAITNSHNLITSTSGRLSAKSKLEQAVFFRTLENNPLSFTGRPELQFDAQELGAAALEVSKDIIDSKTSHISSVSAALDAHFGKRASALCSLAEHLKEMEVPLHRSIRWGLISDAEKLHGAFLMWKSYETAMKGKPAGKKEGLLTHIVEHIREDDKTEPSAESGEVDRVRFWFLNDISRISMVIPWIKNGVKLAAKEQWEDTLGLCKLLIESQDYMISVVGSSYKFREEHLELYGLEKEKLKNGIVQSELEDLPQPWTATQGTTDAAWFLIQATRSAIFEKWPKNEQDVEPGLLEVLVRLSLRQYELVNVTCTTVQEFFLWALAQKDNKVAADEGMKAKRDWIVTRDELISGLADSKLGKIEKAIKLAVKHEVLPVLAELTYLHLADLDQQAKSHPSGSPERMELEAKFKETEAMVDSLYEQFGDRWATAVFENFAHAKACQKILTDPHQKFVTKFLRSRKEFAKIAWINEILKEDKISKGAEILLEIGAREQKLWNKKVELSIGKLARLADPQEFSQAEGLVIPDGGQADLLKIKKDLALIKIQEQAFEGVFPIISSAIDEKAGLELATDTFGNKDVLKDTPALRHILDTNLGHLIEHQALDPISLIDLLTLMGSPDPEQYDVSGREFYSALKVLHQSNLSNEEQALNERVIWRRCFIRDEWSEVNNTALKDDDETTANLRCTALYSTLKACFEDRIFEAPASLQLLSPTEVLGACSDPEELGQRFSDKEGSDKIALAADMKVEDDRLTTFMETCQLEKWWQECVTLAKDAVDKDVHQKTIEGAEMKKAAGEVARLEEEHFRAAKKKALKNARLLAPLHGLRSGSGSFEGGRSLRASVTRGA